MPDSKLSGTGTTIFTVMSKMAHDHGAINLSQGFPDFDGPQALRDRVSYHINHGHNQYAPVTGVPELREQIAAKVLDLYGCRIDPDLQVTVTPGATEAIYCAVTATIHRGCALCGSALSYATYDPCVTLNGGISRHIPLSYPDFSIDWQRVADTINERTRLIMLNTPRSSNC